MQWEHHKPGGECCISRLASPRRIPLPFKAVLGLLLWLPTAQAVVGWGATQVCCNRLHVHVCHEGPTPYHHCGVRMRRAAVTISLACSCRWDTGLIFSLPDTLNQLLVPYITMDRAQLTDSPFAFADLGGCALTKTSMSSYFHSMLSWMDPAFPKSLPHC